MMSSKRRSRRSARPVWTIREGASRRDMFFLKWQWEHYFGTGCTRPGYLPAPLADVLGWTVAEEDRPLDVTTWVIEHRGVLIGGGIATIESREDAIEEIPDGTFDPAALAGDRNAWLWFSAVDSAWRGQGIGRALFRHRLRWARDRDADMVFALGWERDGPSSRPLFEEHGFVPVEQFDDYYARESNRDSCPDCGVWTGADRNCGCQMTFWAMDGGDIDV